MIRLAFISVIIITTFISIHAQNQAPGTWKDVTPVPTLSSSGAEVILLDPARPNDMYINFDGQGVWRSTDYGNTWNKASTGINGNRVNSGRAWYADIDRNPNRNPSTAPTLYFTMGYGSLGIWKSTNWGVDWTNVWDGNIYLEDGTTNVSSRIGSDIHSVEIADETDPNHVIVSLHGCWECGNLNGVFETTNGGVTWTDHNNTTFNFTAHADLLFSINPTTWMVSHGTTYPNSELHRTTDRGATWSKVADNTFIGRQTCHVGTTVYASGNGLRKTTNNGATWTIVSGASSKKEVGTIFTSSSRIYVASAPDMWNQDQQLRSAPINNDAGPWTDIALPAAMWNLKPNDGGWTIGSGNIGTGVATFDGTNTILVTSNHSSGIWRYVEPTSGTAINQKYITDNSSLKNRIKPTLMVMETGRNIRSLSKSSTSTIFFDVKGQIINQSKTAIRQAVIVKAR